MSSDLGEKRSCSRFVALSSSLDATRDRSGLMKTRYKYCVTLCLVRALANLMDEQREKEREIISEDFKDELLHKLNELRETNILCDTTIRAQGQDFPAHKCVLSAASPYFRAKFTSHLKENESNLVVLREEKSTTISDVLKFIYTGEASIDSSNAQDLLMIADYLIISSLKSKASNFLESSLTASNCLALESIASRYNCEPLKQAAVAFKLKHFVAVAKSEDFRALDSKDVIELISKDEVDVSDEEEVYQAVIAWVKHDLPSRECLLPELLKCMRLFSMSKHSLRNILDEELVGKNLTCTKVVINALDFFFFPDRFQNMALKPRLSLDKYEPVVVLTGGFNEFGKKKNTQCFVPSTLSWVSLPMMPHPRSHHGAAVCGGILYIMGGADSAPMCCFNPRQNKWRSLGTTFKLKGCSLTCFHEELYLIGGEGSWQDVQIYNPTHDKWRPGASMETCRAGHSSVVLQECIYAIAGHDGTVCQNSVECYNPLTDQWTKISSMSKVRRFAAAATVGDKIVVVGGFGDMTDKTIEPSYEMFERRTNQWSLLSHPLRPRAAHGIASIEGMVYLFGGEDEKFYARGVEYSLDVNYNEWNDAGSIPGPASYFGTSLLKLPKEFIPNQKAHLPSLGHQP